MNKVASKSNIKTSLALLLIFSLSFIIIWGNEKGLLAQESDYVDSLSEVTGTEQAKVLRVVYPVVMPPYTFEDEKGEARGLAIDLLRLWSKKTGTPTRFISASWNEGLKIMREGKADVHASLYFTEERDTYLDYAAVVASSSGGIFSHKSISPLSELQDLRAYRVGAVRGSYHEEYIKKNLPKESLLPYPEWPQMVAAAKRGDVRVFIEDVDSTLYRLKERGLIDEFRYSRGNQLYQNNFWIVVREGESKLYKTIKDGMALITPEERTGIERKWLTLSTEKTEDSLSIAVYNDFSPYAFVNAEGKPVGLFVDIWKLWAKKTGKRVEFLPSNWNESLSSIKKGNADIHSGLFFSDNRLEWFKFSEFFYEVNSTMFYSAKLKAQYNPDIYDGKKIGVIKGSYYEEHLKKENPAPIIISFASMEKMVRAVKNGKIDACLSESLSTMALISRLGISGEFNREELSIPSQKIYASVLKDNKELLSLINEGFSSITKSELADIEQRWVEDPHRRYYKKDNKKINLTESEKAWLKANPNIRLAFPQGHEPSLMKDEAGRVIGVMADYWNLLKSRLGINVEYELAPISELPEMIKNKDIEGLLFSSPKLIKESDLLAAGPEIQSYSAIYGLKTTGEIRFPQDLLDKKVAVIKGHDHTDHVVSAIINKADLIWVESPLEGLKALSRGETDFFIGSIGNSYLVSKYYLFNIGPLHVFWDHPYTLVPAFRSDLSELASILDKGIGLVTDSEFNEILEKWNLLQPQAKSIDFTPEEQAWLDQNHKVRVRVGDFPPYMFVREDEITGIVIDYLNLIAKRTGVAFEFVTETRPWQEALESLMNLQGPDLMTSLSPIAERESYMDFSEPYIVSARVIFTRTDAKFISSIDDLKGRTVAVPHGTLVHKRIEAEYPDINLLFYDTDLESIEALSTGKADAYIGNLTNASYEILHRGFINLKIAAPSPFGDDVYTFGIRKGWPEFRSIINKGLATITSKEEAAIRNRHLAIRYEYGITPTHVLKWMLIITGIAALVILGVLIWNRSLNRMVKERTLKVSQTQAQFGNLIEQSPISIQIHSPDGKLVQSNTAYAKLFALNNDSIAELYEKYNVLKDEQATKLGIMPLIEKSFQGEEVIFTPYKYDGVDTLKTLDFKKPISRTCWVHTRTFPLKNKDGKVTGVVFMSEDITKQKESEQQMNELRSELLHSTRAGTMVELTAALAHELNHPLGSILNNANAAKRFLDNKDPDLDEIRDIIKDIISEDRRASDVMQKLRALMKKAEIQFAPVQINDIISEVLSLTSSELVIKNIPLSKELAKRLPKINGDRIQLQQVFLNLIMNAIDAVKGRKTKNIHISTAKQDNDHIVVCVKDSGSGISEPQKIKLFQPFYTTKKEGMGMGLSVNRTIIKSHEGDIWVENNKEGGAIFFITLPIYKEKKT